MSNCTRWGMRAARRVPGGQGWGAGGGLGQVCLDRWRVLQCEVCLCAGAVTHTSPAFTL